LNLDVEFSELDVHEWSQSLEIFADGEMELMLYRVGVPDSLNEEVGSIDIEAIPSDLIRRFIHLGDQMEGGLLAPLEDGLTVPFEGEEIPFVLNADGLNDFARDVGNIVESRVNEEIQSAVQEINNGGEIYLKDPGYISISVSVEGLELSPLVSLSDSRPIRIVVEVSRTKIHAEYVGGSGTDEELVSQSMNVWTNSLLGANDGGSGFEVPPDEDIVIDVPTPVFEIEDEIISPSVRLRLTLPWGIDFSNFKSQMGRGEISDNDGSQMLTYYVPLCTGDDVESCEEQYDTLSFRMVIGLDFILAQLSMYIGIILALLIGLIMLIRRRRRRKRERKKAKEESETVGHRVSDLRVFEDVSYGDDGLPDMGEFAGLDDKGNIPSESWEDDFNF